MTKPLSECKSRKEVLVWLEQQHVLGFAEFPYPEKEALTRAFTLGAEAMREEAAMTATAKDYAAREFEELIAADILAISTTDLMEVE